MLIRTSLYTTSHWPLNEMDILICFYLFSRRLVLIFYGRVVVIIDAVPLVLAWQAFCIIWIIIIGLYLLRRPLYVMHLVYNRFGQLRRSTDMAKLFDSKSSAHTHTYIHHSTYGKIQFYDFSKQYGARIAVHMHSSVVSCESKIIHLMAT